MSESHGQPDSTPPHGDPDRGLIGDEELPEDLQPDENSVTDGQPEDESAEREPNDSA